MPASIKPGLSPQYAFRPDAWSASNESVTESWETLWSKSSPGTFWMALFQLNTNQMDIRVTIDGTVLFTSDLNELCDDFKIKHSGHDWVGWELEEYESKYWRYRPYVPIRFASEFKIEMKAHSGTKKVVRGISSWSPE